MEVCNITSLYNVTTRERERERDSSTTCVITKRLLHVWLQIMHRTIIIRRRWCSLMYIHPQEQTNCRTYIKHTSRSMSAVSNDSHFTGQLPIPCYWHCLYLFVCIIIRWMFLPFLAICRSRFIHQHTYTQGRSQE